MAYDPMHACAYCGQSEPLVHADLVPAWFHQHASADGDGHARVPRWTVRTGLQVDDVCQACRDRLQAPDDYVHGLFERQLAHWVYRDSALGFEPDQPLLLRWLLRMAYDAARLHGEDTGILGQYRDVATGREPPPPGAELWLRIITPTAPDQDGLMASSGATAVAAWPDWLRIGRLGPDHFGCRHWDFRQVGLHSYSFLLCLKDRVAPDAAHAERVEHTEAIDAAMVATTWIGPRSNVWTPVPWGDAISHTLQSIGCFHLACERVQTAAIAQALGGDNAPVVLTIGHAAIAAGDVASVLAVLAELVATREACLQLRQRVELDIVGDEDDPEPLHARLAAIDVLRAVESAFPYWMFFQHPEGRWIRQLSVLLANPRRDADGRYTLDAQAMGDTVRNWFGFLDELCVRCGVDADTAHQIAREAQDILR